jgi:hypothetical protein
MWIQFPESIIKGRYNVCSNEVCSNDFCLNEVCSKNFCLNKDCYKNFCLDEDCSNDFCSNEDCSSDFFSNKVCSIELLLQFFLHCQLSVTIPLKKNIIEKRILYVAYLCYHYVITY